MKQPKRYAELLVPLGGLLLFLLVPDAARAGVKEALSLCAGVLIPALFPVSVLSACVLRMGGGAAAERLFGRAAERLLGVPGSGAAPLVLGLLGGYPLGAQLAAEACLEGRLSRRDASQLAGLCNQAGPGFLLGAMGALLGSPALGAALMTVQLCSALLTGMLLRAPGAGSSQRPVRSEALPFRTALPASISGSAAAMLRLTGSVVFFRALLCCAERVLPLNKLPPLLYAAAEGVLELSGGAALLTGLSAPGVFPLLAALCAWGGLCVHLQAAEAFSGAGLQMGPYLRCKALQSGIAWLLAELLSPLLWAKGPTSAWLAQLLFLFILFFVGIKKTNWKTEKNVI